MPVVAQLAAVDEERERHHPERPDGEERERRPAADEEAAEHDEHDDPEHRLEDVGVCHPVEDVAVPEGQLQPGQRHASPPRPRQDVEHAALRQGLAVVEGLQHHPRAGQLHDAHHDPDQPHAERRQCRPAADGCLEPRGARVGDAHDSERDAQDEGDGAGLGEQEEHGGEHQWPPGACTVQRAEGEQQERTEGVVPADGAVLIQRKVAGDEQNAPADGQGRRQEDHGRDGERDRQVNELHRARIRGHAADRVQHRKPQPRVPLGPHIGRELHERVGRHHRLPRVHLVAPHLVPGDGRRRDHRVQSEREPHHDPAPTANLDDRLP